MVRTQIYITDDERTKLRRLARQSGRKQSELVRTAIDDFLTRALAAPRRDVLRECRGMWKNRTQAEFQAVRTEVEARMAI